MQSNQRTAPCLIPSTKRVLFGSYLIENAILWSPPSISPEVLGLSNTQPRGQGMKLQFFTSICACIVERDIRL